jgi:hypothetical protein
LVDNSDDEMAVDNTGGFLSMSLNESHKNDVTASLYVISFCSNCSFCKIFFSI